MPDAVNILWTILLIVALLLLPFILMLLHSSYRKAMYIERYMREMHQAAEEIALYTAKVRNLQVTNKTLTGIADASGKIEVHTNQIKSLLSDRALKFR